MADKRASGRSLDEWMDLVTECRQSGLTDAAWCNEHGISPSCFYNAVTRLRKKACQIPDPAGKASTLDLTSHKQDVVQIAIEPETSPAELLPNSETFMLKVRGNSMIDVGIYDGDRVIVEQTSVAENGEIVVALIDDSATVKRFFKENGHYRLQPENATMDPIIVDKVQILGKVIGLLRLMR